MITTEGGCHCGAIRFAIKAEPLAAGACYCRHCQYAAGGAPSHGLLIPRAGFTLLTGEPTAYWTEADSGQRVARFFCPVCGTPLYSGGADHPELISIRPGALDDPGLYHPQGSIWVASAQPWHRIDKDNPQWPGNPPVEDVLPGA